MNNDVMFSKKSDEWATPIELFNELDKEFAFNLDPCATDENHKCAKYYTKNDDGLSKSWGGAVFSSTRHIPNVGVGSKRRFTKPNRKTRLLCCLYHHEPTQSIFTILF